jgi:hypothetical protein
MLSDTVRLLLTLAVLPLTTLAAGINLPENMTPLLLAVHAAPVPFTGSDGCTHLVYELWITNFSSGDAVLEKVEVLGEGAILESMDSAAIARRLQPAGLREPVRTLAKSLQALLFIHVTLKPAVKAPAELSHRVVAHVSAAPPGHQTIRESGGNVAVPHREVAHIGPPLHGDRFISADSCCDATRHTRAALAVNGHVWIAQRYAVDWEQLDAQGRIYSGPREKLQSYTIFGAPVLAVADAMVVSVTDKLPEQHPGKYPDNISLDTADGNSIVLDLGQQRYALYAHMQPGSIRVQQGQRVKLGQVIGLVGNSGNSVAPHLHFQVMDSPSSLASNGLPYEIDTFHLTGKSPGTEAFDQAEANGTPLQFTPLTPTHVVKYALPLDQLVLSFPAAPRGL